MSTRDNTSRLAIDGGPPVRHAPFSPWPHYDRDEIEAVAAVLASGQVNYWTGQECRRFEEEYAARCGVGHAVALMNGTVALELALHTLGIGPGDEVVTASRTFIASASCAVMRGARPVIADVDPVSQNITAETIAAALTPRTKAIVAVHLAGWPCDMDAILALARKHGLKVIEDCAQAHGATWKGRPVGSFGDAAAFSFCQDKIITTGGEGGMLVTDDPEVWQKAWSFKDHGKGWNAVYNRAHPPGFRWLHESFGTNWRMTELQAAIGRLQLAKLPAWRAARQRNAEVLEKALADVPGLRLTPVPDHVGHARYRYYTFLKPERLRPEWDQLRVIEAVKAEGVPCFSGSCSEIYLEQAFVSAGWAREPLPVAQALGMTSLCFLVHPTLMEADMRDTAAAVSKVMQAASR